jgi:hypothetical protein
MHCGGQKHAKAVMTHRAGRRWVLKAADAEVRAARAISEMSGTTAEGIEDIIERDGLLDRQELQSWGADPRRAASAPA